MRNRPTRQQLADDYRSSSTFTRDAVEWFADLDIHPVSIATAIGKLYTQSTAYSTVIDDADELNERRWQSRLNHPSNRGA